MGDTDLLEMLASETDRRCAVLVEGLEGLAGADAPDTSAVARLRGEGHGLKGAAMVVGQTRLAGLAEQMEAALAGCEGTGTIPPDLNRNLITATRALHQGASAAAEGREEPEAVGIAIGALAA